MSRFCQVDQPSLPEPRNEASHKGDFGHVLVVAGSRRMMGAAALCSIAASRVGSGLVTLACPASMQPQVAQAWPTIMTLPLRETFDGGIALGAWSRLEEFFDRATVIAAGPGLGLSPSTILLVHRLIERAPLPLVLDADALNALAGHTELLKSAKGPVVVTPHPGEMARLTGRTVAEIQQDRGAAAHEFVQGGRVTLVLKGAGTVVAGSGQLYVNASGNPYMASGGVGDVLTGMIAGLLAQKMTPFDAARTAVFWHGLAADRAPNAGGPGAVTALDILDQLRKSGTDIDWYGEELRLEDEHTYDPDRPKESGPEDLEEPPW